MTGLSLQAAQALTLEQELAALCTPEQHRRIMAACRRDARRTEAAATSANRDSLCNHLRPAARFLGGRGRVPPKWKLMRAKALGEGREQWMDPKWFGKAAQA